VHVGNQALKKLDEHLPPCGGGWEGSVEQGSSVFPLASHTADRGDESDLAGFVGPGDGGVRLLFGWGRVALSPRCHPGAGRDPCGGPSLRWVLR
jgi:hypothetical protein